MAVAPVPPTCRLKLPVVVPHVEVAPPVNVKAPPEVKLDAPVGVSVTAPAPEAVKFPLVSVSARSWADEVVIV